MPHSVGVAFDSDSCFCVTKAGKSESTDVRIGSSKWTVSHGHLDQIGL